MKPDPEPFFKWDPDGESERRRRAARHLIDGASAEEADRLAGLGPAREDPLAGKRWILRWAWAISTGVLVFGYLIIVAHFTGWSEWLHLT